MSNRKLSAIPAGSKFIFVSAKGWANYPGVHTKSDKPRWDRRGTIVVCPDGLEKVFPSTMAVKVIE